jgi:hypothetical protein
MSHAHTIAQSADAETLRTTFNRAAFHVRASYLDETAEIVRQLTSVDFNAQNNAQKHAGSKVVDMTILTRDGRAGR